MKTKYCLIFLMALGLTLTACNQQGGNEATGQQTVAPATADTQDDNEETHLAAAVPAVEENTATRPAPRPQPKPVAAPAKPKAAAAPAKPSGKAETIYVETYGAQGKVWGHVTMTGDRGSGTIHDADENTLAVTVTRHGDELFAIDQNSRQYVFKLKK